MPIFLITGQVVPGAALPRGRGGWHHGGVDYLLAQVNIGRMREPLDSPLLADFVAALDPVNAAADTAPGFVWRLQTEDGNATAVHAFEWDRAGSAGVLVNMSVWESVEALAAYVYSDTHREVLRRRRQWFERMAEAQTALWWIPRGHTPTTDEAEQRVIHLREFGPTPYAFTLKEHFPPPDVTGSGPISSPEEWTCPA
jgi:heme-degrading monooxygenase HmoA